MRCLPGLGNTTMQLSFCMQKVIFLKERGSPAVASFCSGLSQGCCSDSCRSALPRWLPLISVLKTGGKSVTTVSHYQLPKFCECSSYGWRNTDSWIIPETQYQLLNQESPDRQHLPTSFVVSWQKCNSRWWSVTFIMGSEGGFCNSWVRREHPL